MYLYGETSQKTQKQKYSRKQFVQQEEILYVCSRLAPLPYVS